MKAEEFYFKNYLNALYKAVIAEELNDENNTVPIRLPACNALQRQVLPSLRVPSHVGAKCKAEYEQPITEKV